MMHLNDTQKQFWRTFVHINNLYHATVLYTLAMVTLIAIMQIWWMLKGAG